MELKNFFSRKKTPETPKVVSLLEQNVIDTGNAWRQVEEEAGNQDKKQKLKEEWDIAKQAYIDQLLSEGKQEEAKEFIREQIDFKRKAEMGLLGRTAEMSNKWVEKWDKWGVEHIDKNGNKVEGNAWVRTAKNFINIAVIGGAASLIAPGQTVNSFGKRLAIGLGFGAVVEGASPKNKKIIGQALALGGGAGIALATGGGLLAAGLAVGVGAGAYFTMKGLAKLKAKFGGESVEKIEEKIRETEKNINFTTLDLSAYEKEYSKLLDQARNKRLTRAVTRTTEKFVITLGAMELAAHAQEISNEIKEKADDLTDKIEQKVESDTKTEDDAKTPEQVKEETPKTETPEEPKITERGFQNKASFKLGEDGVPRNLETAFHAIAADHMEVGDAGVNEEFGAKSLNVAANLVKLSQGINLSNIEGVSVGDFNDSANFDPKTGVLTIKDPACFNEMLEKLENHADKLWDNGVLQKGATAYLDNIKEDSWVKILHAEGMDNTGSIGDAEGIKGHDHITKDHITDFDKSEMVNKAEASLEGSSSANTRGLGAGDTATPIENTPIESTPIENNKPIIEALDQKNWIGGDNEAWDNIKDTNAAELYSKYLNTPEKLSVEETEICKEFEKHNISWADAQKNNRTVEEVWNKIEGKTTVPTENLENKPNIQSENTEKPKTELSEQEIQKISLDISTKEHDEFINELFAGRRLFRRIPGLETELWKETQNMPIQDLTKIYSMDPSSLKEPQIKLIQEITSMKNQLASEAPVIYEGESTGSYLNRIWSILTTQKIKTGEISTEAYTEDFDGYGPDNR